MKLKFLGVTLQRYSGIDHGRNHTQFLANKGEVVEVSDVKAEKLLTDFPQDWVKEGREPAPVRELKEAPPVEVEPESGKVPKKNKAVLAPKKLKRK